MSESPNKKKLVLIGAGGHAKSVVDVIEQSDNYNIIGYTDESRKSGAFWGNYPYLGDDQSCLALIGKDVLFMVTVGMIKNLTIRASLFYNFQAHGARFATVYSCLAYISKYASIGEGSVIMHQALVNTGVKIGVNCIINTKAVVEHDSIVGNHTHISTGAIVNADCEIGHNVFISSNVAINRGVRIGHNTIVGSGAVVTKDIPSNAVAYGVPAQIVGTHA